MKLVGVIPAFDEEEPVAIARLFSFI